MKAIGLIRGFWCWIVLTLAAVQLAEATESFCASGDVTCLIAAINEANGTPGEHVINLEPGSYRLQTVDNVGVGANNGLPVVASSIRIQAAAEDLPTIIERTPNAPGFRIFQVSAGGELHLDGITVQRGTAQFGTAIFNSGVTSLHNSVVRNSGAAFAGAIVNAGSLRVIKSKISDNRGGFEGGGIVNLATGDLLVENSTIENNFSQTAGGILNQGTMVVKNSAIIANSSDGVLPGGGISNQGTAEIVNTTISNNVGSRSSGGGGVSNSGWISITNSTIRDNTNGNFPLTSQRGAAGIANGGGTVQIQNTIVAGNDSNGPVGPDCSGTITSLGNNLVGDPTDCDINLQPSDLIGDPGLGALVGTVAAGKAFYPVLAGSVVIDRANPAACPKKDQLGNPRVETCDIGAVEFQDSRLLVSIDIRPRSDANRINPNSTNNINVAILSVNGFDARTVDPNTVRFGATGTEAAPVDVGRRDVDGDGNRDLVLRFQIPDTGISCGDSSATLTGNVLSGPAIIGSSPIKTVQCQMSQR